MGFKFHKRTRMDYWSNSKLVAYLDRNSERQKTKKTLVLDESYGFIPEDPEYGQPTKQALMAQEQEVIYDWWKASKAIEGDYCVEYEEKYKKEETEMLIRLIKIRDSLWT